MLCIDRRPGHHSVRVLTSTRQTCALSYFNMLQSTCGIQTNVSKLAQESLRELKRLRILLTRLLETVDATSEDTSDEDCVPLTEGTDSEAKLNVGTRTNIVPSPVTTAPDGKLTVASTDQRGVRTSKNKFGEPIQLHKLVLQISETLESMDQLANRMHSSRFSSKLGELGLHNALSILTTVDQLDFTGSAPAVGDSGDSLDQSAAAAVVEPENRRVDWLTDRMDAERWSNRYWERTHTVLEGLLTCSVFRRSHINSDLKRHRLDSLTSGTRDVRADLEYLLNEPQHLYPKLLITVVESGSNVTVVHVRVGEVMQCFITFRRLHPERIIVRGLTESMLYKSPKVSNSTTESVDTDSETLSKPMDEMLSSKLSFSSSTKDTLISLLAPDPRASLSASDSRNKKTVASASFSQQSNSVTTVGIQSLDLVTPSRFSLFQRITSLAQSALLHYSNDYQPPSAVRGLLVWLHSYHDLFTSPCTRCGQLLGQDVTLPLWRSYLHMRKDENRPIEAQHEHCQAIV
ncbi:uncharacterized protein DEA37_0005819 [Paragonimus westermani]|uniref:Mediator of RNA polymerase II transcription subunit 27 n=1 Tax=Paragonimus westermani TaxID=34504 RepID=A0A5J4NEM7_9TREM|nr:uncharacterized protein DEA37_0005819 [Paragonimus westermani]